nr:MAG TPA: hypothetical protein [Caudoviricetes sp.]
MAQTSSHCHGERPWSLLSRDPRVIPSSSAIFSLVLPGIWSHAPTFSLILSIGWLPSLLVANWLALIVVAFWLLCNIFLANWIFF